MHFYNPSTRAPTPTSCSDRIRKKKRQNPHDKDVVYSDTLIHLRLGPCMEEEEYIRGILVPKFSHSLSSLVPFRRNTPVWWRAFPVSQPAAAFVRRRECVLFVFMHMNSIRWMPMIRWLKFPFRVHILHKTVQLSVHELRGGDALCVWLKACPTVPPSNSEQAEGFRRGRRERGREGEAEGEEERNRFLISSSVSAFRY